jgi:hypothetical protein
MLLFQYFLAFFFELRVWNCVILNCVWTGGGVYLNKLLDIIYHKCTYLSQMYRSSGKVYYFCPIWTKLRFARKLQQKSETPQEKLIGGGRGVECVQTSRSWVYFRDCLANEPKRSGAEGGQKPQFFTPWSPSISLVYLTNGLLNTVPVTLHSIYSTTHHDWANSWLHATKRATIVMTGATVRQQLLGFTAS